VPAHFWSDSALARVRRPLASGDAGMFAAMFDEHARHVFDYCKSILTDEAEAARASEVTFITASSLLSWLRDHDRLRPWLFALARNECTSSSPGRAALAGCPELPGRSDHLGLRHEPPAGYMSEPDTDALRLAAIEARIRLMEQGQAVGSLVLDPPREARMLVYRHGISPRELPAILGIPAKQAKTLLAEALAGARTAQHAADKMSIGIARRQRPVSSPDDSVEAAYKAALAMPLAVPPPDVWRRAARVAIDPEFWECRDSVVECAGQLGFDGFPMDRAMSLAKARARLRLVAIVTVPGVAAVAAVGILYLGHSPAPAGGSRPASETLHTGGTGLGASASASASSQGPKAKPRHRGHVTVPLAPAPPLPTASKSAKPKPKPSSTPTKSSTPTPSASTSASASPSQSSSSSASPTDTSTAPTTAPTS
jgi:DNA-directed RNA polymerase specialized sigma24 family protein